MNSARSALVGAVAAIAFLLLTAASCDDSHANAPDPAPGTFVNAPNVRGFKMPDGYRNVAAFCDGPNMVYVSSRGGTGSAAEGTSSSLYVIANDPRCAK